MNSKLSKVYRGILRNRLNRMNRDRLLPEAKEVSILCSNCVGGVIYHELGLKMLTPTINLYIKPKDFLKLAFDPKQYLNENIYRIEQEEFAFPILRLGDILLYCNHAKSYTEAKYQWEKRKDRFNYEKYCIIMCERDGCTYEDLARFDKLKNQHKVVFVHRLMPEIQSSVYLPGTEIVDNEHGIVSLTSYISHFSGKRYIDLFDYVAFMNQCARNE